MQVRENLEAVLAPVLERQPPWRARQHIHAVHENHGADVLARKNEPPRRLPRDVAKRKRHPRDERKAQVLHDVGQAGVAAAAVRGRDLAQVERRVVGGSAAPDSRDEAPDVQHGDVDGRGEERRADSEDGHAGADDGQAAEAVGEAARQEGADHAADDEEDDNVALLVSVRVVLKHGTAPDGQRTVFPDRDGEGGRVSRHEGQHIQSTR